jgi:hypothetical protein
MKLFNRSWDIVHNEECPDLDSSPNYIRVVKSRGMRWAKRVARKGLRESGKKRVYLEDVKCRWEGDIKVDLIENYFERSDFNSVAQDG